VSKFGGLGNSLGGILSKIDKDILLIIGLVILLLFLDDDD